MAEMAEDTAGDTTAVTHPGGAMSRILARLRNHDQLDRRVEYVPAHLLPPTPPPPGEESVGRTLLLNQVAPGEPVRVKRILCGTTRERCREAGIGEGAVLEYRCSSPEGLVFETESGGEVTLDLWYGSFVEVEREEGAGE